MSGPASQAGAGAPPVPGRAGLLRRLEGRLRQLLFPLHGAESGEVLLHRRRVYILPTNAGLGFCALVLVLLVGATNYNLGLGFALAFLLVSCGLVDMLLTYRNLANLRLRAGRVAPVFAGAEARFELVLINRSALERYAIGVDFVGTGPRYLTDAAAGGETLLTLACPTSVRGSLAAPRVRLVTRFPLGLFRAWGYWQPAMRALVYPFPESEAPALPLAGANADDGRGSAGQDDFGGIRNYQAGDSMRSLAWRQIARLDLEHGGQLVTKHFEGGGADELVLDFAAIASTVPVEARLSRMTRWVLMAEQRGLPYGFRLGSLHLQAGHGAAHQAACLQALALYGSGAAL
ncbi:DUF58 domain-containing protein [Massilia sp. DWR3-1-1]|uniref:DUF58 domain-containing protein n=1 Tax=Massilia sp. DWR3-1-1 TaxID=2804559 RepID=UPI003CEC29AF